MGPHEAHPPATPAERQLDTQRLVPGSSRALKRGRNLAEAPEVAPQRRHDTDAEFGAERGLVGQAEPAQHERHEPEVQRRAGRPPVRLAQQFARRLPQLRGQTGPVTLQLRHVLRGEGDAVRERVERRQ